MNMHELNSDSQITFDRKNYYDSQRMFAKFKFVISSRHEKLVSQVDNTINWNRRMDSYHSLITLLYNL